VTPAFVFDLLLCLCIIAVAISAVLARDLLAAIVFFIVYGLLVAVAWVRLDAVNVALAEAAIGAGLTGILLVGALGRLRSGSAASPRPLPDRRALTRMPHFALGVGIAGILVALAVSLSGIVSGLHRLVQQNLEQLNVANPVTAVLLGFRGYDTLLETFVLAVALVGVWSLTADRFWGGRPGLKQHARPEGVLAYFGRLLPAVGLLVGVHLLWAGTDAPGGAFQAGTVLAAVWLLTVMAGLSDAPPVSNTTLRALLVIGPGGFLLFGLAGALAGVFLQYPAGAAKAAIIAIESLLTVSIAATLGLLVLGTPRRLP
jgi:multisubunit Na+/H+ antiporter MnhB subunit